MLDIVLLWLLRPPVFAGLSGERSGYSSALVRTLRGFELFLAIVTSIVCLWFSIVVATIPGEWQETVLAALDRPRWQITYVDVFGKVQTKLVSTHDLLFAGEVYETTRRRKSLFSNTLVLPGFNLFEALKIDDPKKLAWRKHLFDLRGRHLEKAVLDGADFTKADLHGAQLEGATLDLAQLQGASFWGAQLQGASLQEAQLQGASLYWADLRGATLERAQLQGASLERAQLQGASLEDAELQGASLLETQLQGASLRWADLRGATLLTAQLQGASLVHAAVNGVEFSYAYLWRSDWSDWGEIDRAKLGAVRFYAAWEPWKPVWKKFIFCLSGSLPIT
jgi:uncharacterized protein YjbI with pentapeptide repeats